MDLIDINALLDDKDYTQNDLDKLDKKQKKNFSKRNTEKIIIHPVSDIEINIELNAKLGLNLNTKVKLDPDPDPDSDPDPDPDSNFDSNTELDKEMKLDYKLISTYKGESDYGINTRYDLEYYINIKPFSDNDKVNLAYLHSIILGYNMFARCVHGEIGGILLLSNDTTIITEFLNNACYKNICECDKPSEIFIFANNIQEKKNISKW